MSDKCNACFEPLERPYMRVEFVGAAGSALDGAAFKVHANCLRIVTRDRGIALPETEPDLVTVSGQWGEWEAVCRDHGAVALKEELDDAHMAAARHIARRHAAA